MPYGNNFCQEKTKSSLKVSDQGFLIRLFYVNTKKRSKRGTTVPIPNGYWIMVDLVGNRPLPQRIEKMLTTEKAMAYLTKLVKACEEKLPYKLVCFEVLLTPELIAEITFHLGFVEGGKFIEKMFATLKKEAGIEYEAFFMEGAEMAPIPKECGGIEGKVGVVLPHGLYETEPPTLETLKMMAKELAETVALFLAVVI